MEKIAEDLTDYMGRDVTPLDTDAEEWRSREKYGPSSGAYVHPNDPGDIRQSDFI